MRIVTFNNRRAVEPGAYSQILGGSSQSPDVATSGNVMIIDDGIGAGYGYGSGINGELANALNSIYGFDRLDDFQKAVRGGALWEAAKLLFNPSRDGRIKGCNRLFVVTAATTTKSTISYTFTGGATNDQTCVTATTIPASIGIAQVNTITIGAVVDENDTFTATIGVTNVTYTAILGDTPSAVAAGLKALIDASTPFTSVLTTSILANVISLTANTTNTPFTQTSSATNAAAAGGTITFNGITEGIRANGVLTGPVLTVGFAMKMIAGISDNTKFILQLWQGTFKGLDDDGVSFDDIAASSTNEILLTQSPEFRNISEIIDWAKTDQVLNQYYTHGTSSVVGLGTIGPNDLTANIGYVLSTGGTTTYGTADFTAVLDAIKEVDNTFFLSDKYGDNAQNIKNSQLLAHMQTAAEFDKFMVVGGGANALKFTQANGSIPTAKFFNSEKVFVTHSDIKIPSSTAPLGYKIRSTFYHAAAACGRMAGLDPQTPLTWKDLNVIGVTHELTLSQREQALLAGVLHLKNIPNLGWIVNQDVNTLQKNMQEINQDGTSFEGSLMRIAAQLNKELTMNLREKFVGKNVATASPADVKSFVEGYLQFRTANKQVDNLILLGKNVNVQLIGSDYQIKYSFVPNGPVNRLFTTGFMLDINLSA